jgi:hypothetical protein
VPGGLACDCSLLSCSQSAHQISNSYQSARGLQCRSARTVEFVRIHARGLDRNCHRRLFWIGLVETNAGPTRNEKDLGSKFPEVKDSIAALGIRDAVIDRQIVALDEKGRSSFQLMQAHDIGEKRPPSCRDQIGSLPNTEIKAAAHLTVLQGMSKGIQRRYQPRLNILACIALLHAIRSLKPPKPVWQGRA